MAEQIERPEGKTSNQQERDETREERNETLEGQGAPGGPEQATPGGPEQATHPGTVVSALTRGELLRAFLLPHRIIDSLLGMRRRLAFNLSGQRNLALLALLLLFTTAIYAIPFSAVPPIAAFWKVALLFMGSVLICFPSFHIFSRYLELPWNISQNLVLILLIPAVAALIAFGFFPIIWFIDQTSTGAFSARITSRIAMFLLYTALFLGALFCFRLSRDSRKSGVFITMYILWIGLLAFISHRMAQTLSLT